MYGFNINIEGDMKDNKVFDFREWFDKKVDELEGDPEYEAYGEAVKIAAKLCEEYHQSQLQALREKVEGLLEHHAKGRDESDKDFEYAHHHGIVEGMVKVLSLIDNLTEGQ